MNHVTSTSPTDYGSGDPTMRSRAHLDIAHEWRALQEAHDIIEELRMMTQIFSDQLRITNQFSKILMQLHDNEGQFGSLSSLKEPEESHHGRPVTDTILEASEDERYDMLKRSRVHKRVIVSGTLQRARNVGENIEIRIQELGELEASAKEITDALGDFISLKTQQVSIIESELSLELARESVTQGRSIMLFTIITIIFLPLSFMSSLFGMNARELSGPTGAIMSLRYQFTFMFPISIFVILVSIALAFSAWTRSLISLIVTVAWALFIQFSGLGSLWAKGFRTYDTTWLQQSKRDIVSEIHEKPFRSFRRRRRSRGLV